MAMNNRPQEWPPSVIISYELYTQYIHDSKFCTFVQIVGMKFKVFTITVVGKD